VIESRIILSERDKRKVTTILSKTPSQCLGREHYKSDFDASPTDFLQGQLDLWMPIVKVLMESRRPGLRRNTGAIVYSQTPLWLIWQSHDWLEHWLF
jgi:hypothetical protein